MKKPNKVSTETRVCIECKQAVSIDFFEPSSRMFENGSLETQYKKRCIPCNEEYLKRTNRKAYPLCPVCGEPHLTFCYAYKGYDPDVIKFCCSSCEPRFNTFTEQEQYAYIEQAALLVYPNNQSIYALVDPRDNTVHAIGRTYRPERRYKEHWRNKRQACSPEQSTLNGWKITAYWLYELDEAGYMPTMQILETVAYGPIAPERELRYIFHGIHEQWPLHNLEAMDKELVTAMQSIEPLTATYEEIEPYIQRCRDNRAITFIHHVLREPVTLPSQ